MAKRSQFYSVCQDIYGNALEDITVEVFQVDGTTGATIYSGRSGGGTTPSSFDTGADGEVSFFADPGTYVINFSDATLPARISDKSIYWDSVSGDTAGIDGDQIEDNAITLSRMTDDSVGVNELLANSVGYDEQIAPTIITNSISNDVTIVGADTYNNGPQITLNQGAGVYVVWASIELKNTVSAPNTTLIYTSRLVKFGDTNGFKEQSSRHYVGSNAGYGITHTYFDMYVASSNNEIIIAQAKDNLGGASVIESDRGHISAFRFA